MRSRRIRSLALVVAVVTLASTAWIPLEPHPDVFYPVGIGLADLALGVLILLSVGPVLGRLHERRLGVIGWLTTTLFVLVLAAFAMHPSVAGAFTIFRLVAACAIGLAVAELRGVEERRLLLFAIGAVAVVETALGAAQLAAGDILVAYPHPPVLSVGPFIRPAGTLQNSIVFAGYALVLAALVAARAITRGSWWSLLVALAAAPAGFTFSRAALLAAGAATLSLLPGALHGRAHERSVFFALAGGVGIATLLTIAGWTARGEQYPAEASANRRVELITQTLPMLAEHPVLGIGPGNTVTALADRKANVPGSVDLTQPPHNVPYLIALESGLPAGIAVLALLTVLGIRALRTGPSATLAFLVLLPHLLVDQYPWTAMLGLPLVGLWLGAVCSPPDEPT